jgi:hypothetical protein
VSHAKTRLDLEQWHFTVTLASMVPFWHRRKKKTLGEQRQPLPCQHFEISCFLNLEVKGGDRSKRPRGHPFGDPSCRARCLTVERQNNKKGAGLATIYRLNARFPYTPKFRLFPHRVLW